MQRPIFFNGTNYYICRPPEMVKDLILDLPYEVVDRSIITTLDKLEIDQDNLQCFKKVMEMTGLIYDKVSFVIKHSNENKISTNSSAIQIAKDRIKKNSKK